MNKETLEESTKKLILTEWLEDDKVSNLAKWGIEMGFEKGVKWQQEQNNNKFSEEDMYEIMDLYVLDVMGGCILSAKEWFEQYKNK